MVASGIVQFAVGEASVEEIDRVNILQATFMAMRRALQALVVLPAVVLIDGNQIPPRLGCKAETIVGGDARSYSIAAASIFAKVTRDRYMASLAQNFPGYGWETNRGYGTEAHLVALKQLGPTPHHRMTLDGEGRLKLSPPSPFNGDKKKFKAFMRKLNLYFASDPAQFANQMNKVILTLSLCSEGSAEVWAICAQGPLEGSRPQSWLLHTSADCASSSWARRSR
jgi:hypothetical protein